MTDDRSLERAARSWLDEGPTQAPDRAVEAALAQIDTTNQERALRPWRMPNMNLATKLAAAAFVAAVAIGGSLYLLGPNGYGGRPTPTPSAVPATPAASPSAAALTPGPTPNAAACQLLTSAEVAASSGISIDPGSAGPRARATEATSDCVYATGGGIGDIVASVELTKPGGAAAFNTAKAIAGVQAISDLGAEAVFNPVSSTLYVLQGDTLVSLTAGIFADTPAKKLAQVTALARLVIPRM